MSVTTSVSPSRAARADAVTRWILVDAAMSSASGLLLAAGAAWLDTVFGPPTDVLVALGVFLLAYSGGLVLVARAGSPRPVVVAVVAGNAVWVLASVVAVIADWLTLTTAGTVLTLLQAAAVALVADMQALALKRRVS